MIFLVNSLVWTRLKCSTLRKNRRSNRPTSGTSHKCQTVHLFRRAPSRSLARRFSTTLRRNLQAPRPTRRRSCPTTKICPLSSLSFSTFYYRARPGRRRLWQPSTTVVYHSAFASSPIDDEPLFCLGAISVITRNAELIEIGVYHAIGEAAKLQRELRSRRKRKSVSSSRIKYYW